MASPDARRLVEGDRSISAISTDVMRKVWTSSPLARSHNLIVRSVPLEARRFPCAEKATSRTLPLCPRRACRRTTLPALLAGNTSGTGVRVFARGTVAVVAGGDAGVQPRRVTRAMRMSGAGRRIFRLICFSLAYGSMVARGCSILRARRPSPFLAHPSASAREGHAGAFPPFPHHQSIAQSKSECNKCTESRRRSAVSGPAPFTSLSVQLPARQPCSTRRRSAIPENRDRPGRDVARVRPGQEDNGVLMFLRCARNVSRRRSSRLMKSASPSICRSCKNASTFSFSPISR